MTGKRVHLEETLKILLDRLGFTLPSQPPPRITAAETTAALKPSRAQPNSSDVVKTFTMATTTFRVLMPPLGKLT